VDSSAGGEISLFAVGRAATGRQDACFQFLLAEITARVNNVEIAFREVPADRGRTYGRRENHSSSLAHGRRLSPGY
jgi:hypothetical protein